MKPWKLCFIPIGMFGFGFALVPLYDVFCDVTGLNGKPDLTQRQFEKVEFLEEVKEENRSIKFQLISDANARDQYSFLPVDPSLRVQLGQLYRTSFKLYNPTKKTLTFQAIPSVSPGLSAQYLAKMECFCFNQQIVKAGETVDMPLVFQVSQALPDDVNQMTLAYTLYVLDDLPES
jgi:cytochrome c oxidase assembly protein subunit 11